MKDPFDLNFFFLTPGERIWLLIGMLLGLIIVRLSIWWFTERR